MTRIWKGELWKIRAIFLEEHKYIYVMLYMYNKIWDAVLTKKLS